MRRNPETGKVVLCPQAGSGIEEFHQEDLEHIEDAVFQLQEKLKATCLPGLEAVYAKVRRRIEG